MLHCRDLPSPEGRFHPGWVHSALHPSERMSSMFGKPRGVNAVNVSSTNERNHHSHIPECNIALLGLRGAGKSALTVKFLTKRFISEYDPNLEDTYTSEEIVDHLPVLLKVMDTADQDGPVACERYLHWAHAFMVIYSIDNKQSFEGCQKYLDILSQHLKETRHDCPVLLLGNKLDIERYRQVSKSEGLSLASAHGCMFHEVSACLDFESVQIVFHEAVRQVRREAERHLPIRPLFITEEKALVSLSAATPLPAKHSLAMLGTLSAASYREIPSMAQAKLVTVKSSRAQSKRKAPTLTLLKGFKIF